MSRWDHLGWPGDALAAWMDPGDDPEQHRQAQETVRAVMPLLAVALDRQAEAVMDPGPRRPRRLRQPGESYPLPPWERRDTAE